MSEFLIESLEKGREIEKSGIKFYKEAADLIDDPRGKSTLMFLSKEEEHHLGFILKLIDSAGEGLELPLMADRKIQGVFPDKDEFKEKIAGTEVDRKIIEEAIQIEERSIEFYSSCIEKVDENEKGIFRTLVKEEEKHKSWLNFMKEGMDVHGYWYGIEDYFALDG